MLGEKLLIKLWDTIADKGVGGLLSPWQISRTERARTEARKRELIHLAEAERQAEAIRSGRATFSDDGNKIKFIELQNSDEVEVNSVVDNSDDQNNLIQRVISQDIADSIQKDVNVTKALLHAEKMLSEDGAEPAQENVDEDWVYRWKEYAGKVSAEDLQELWGAVLAGEVKRPNTYNLRLLDFLKNISKSEAKLIEKCAIHNLSGAIAADEKRILERQGMDYPAILSLQELGIIQGAEATNMTMQFDSDNDSTFSRALISNDLAMLIQHPDPKKKLKFKSYGITGLGKQMFSLGKFEANRDYLTSIGEKFLIEGYKVSIGECTLREDGMFSVVNVKEITSGDGLSLRL